MPATQVIEQLPVQEESAQVEPIDGRSEELREAKTKITLDENQTRLIAEMRKYAEKAGEHYTTAKMLTQIFEYGCKSFGRTCEMRVYKFQAKRNETVSAASLQFSENVHL